MRRILSIWLPALPIERWTKASDLAPDAPVVLTVRQWVERDLMLRDVAWPRRAFVQLVGVPANGLRIGRDAPPPKVTAAAYEWVWADRSVPGGWRPMRGSDLLRFYTFPQGQPAHVVLDLRTSMYDYPGKVSWSRLRLRTDGTVTGFRETRGWAPGRQLYFAMRFSRPVTGHAFHDTEVSV